MKYTVKVWRTVSYVGITEVEGRNSTEASDAALDMARDDEVGWDYFDEDITIGNVTEVPM